MVPPKRTFSCRTCPSCPICPLPNTSETSEVGFGTCPLADLSSHMASAEPGMETRSNGVMDGTGLGTSVTMLLSSCGCSNLAKDKRADRKDRKDRLWHNYWAPGEHHE